MAMTLTNQVRSIAEVTKAAAGGDLMKTMSVERSWNNRVLSVFADEVTRVAREGKDGRSVGWSSQGHECWWDVEGSDG
ncbi:hypothetical protein BYT27DRAFT_6438372 [Phlegmacium glaucopus]|nr:hypothetical protein BYT27DRAFT_6438372 [Phlegmacium glaucopus]